MVKNNLRICDAVRQTKGVKVDVKTPDGNPMTVEAATLPVGSALRIAPDFLAATTDDSTGVETTIAARYEPDAGRYVVADVRNRAVRSGVEINNITLRQVPIARILQAAAPQCIALTLDDEHDPDAAWVTADQLTTTEGRILPAWLAEDIVKRGNWEARVDTIEILYGIAALAGSPPVQLVKNELGVPHRTASDWIKKARSQGRLNGMTYIVGRQADG